MKGNRKGAEGEAWEEKGDRHGRNLSGDSGAKPHELQPVGEKLTESVAQPCSILCTANQSFKISTSECVRYPPKCAFSRVSNKIFFLGGGTDPTPMGRTPPLDSTAHKLPNLTKIGTPTFWNKVTPMPCSTHQAPRLQFKHPAQINRTYSHNIVLVVI